GPDDEHEVLAGGPASVPGNCTARQLPERRDRTGRCISLDTDDSLDEVASIAGWRQQHDNSRLPYRQSWSRTGVLRQRDHVAFFQVRTPERCRGQARGVDPVQRAQYAEVAEIVDPRLKARSRSAVREPQYAGGSNPDVAAERRYARAGD